MNTISKVVSAVMLGLFPTRAVRPVVNFLGHRVASGASVGFSWVWCDLIAMDHNVRIGHGNIVLVRRLLMRPGSYLGRANVLKGPYDVRMQSKAAIGNRNWILRGRPGVSAGYAQLFLGEMAKITADHRVDCTMTVRIGAFSILAGAGSQVWTHGYVHDVEGPGRYRIDGRVEIESNVYVGSACVISMGVRVSKGIIVGGGTTVSKSLVEPGLYASAPIRRMSRPLWPEERPELCQLPEGRVGETVFVKKRP